MRALAVEGGVEAGTHAVDVVLVDERFHLVVGEVVDLSDLLTGLHVLPEHDVKKPQFAVDLRTHLEFVFALTDQQHVAAHVGEVVFHLIHLNRPIERVLTQAFVDEGVFAARQFVVFLGLHVVFAGDEFLVVELLLLPIVTQATGALEV